MTGPGECAPADTGNDPNGSVQTSEEKVTCGTQTAVNDESEVNRGRVVLCLCLVCMATFLAVAWQQSVDLDQSSLLSSIQSLIHNCRACILKACVP